MSGREILEGLLQAYMAKDLTAIKGYIADDAIFYDPHYPQPQMVGKEAILQGVTWGLSTLEKPGFTIRRIWLDGDSGVAELDTHHVIKGSIETKFNQVFVFETRNGQLTRLRGYVPYAPHGLAGLISKLTRLVWQMQGKLK